MIKFFRQIRQNLLNQGKTAKYFKYAIGEIILVMIGILLALQVNNWNQSRISRVQEIKIYKEILSDLQLTLDEVNKDMSSHNRILLKSKKLIDHLINKKPNNDSILSFLFASIVDLQVYPKTSGYDALNSIGLNLLSNDSVRIDITNLYQLILKRIIQTGWRETPSTDLRIIIEPFINKHITMDFNKNSMRLIDYKIDSIKILGTKIKDYDALLNDKQLLSKLNWSISRRAGKIRKHYSTSQKIEHTMQSIESELIRIE